MTDDAMERRARLYSEALALLRGLRAGYPGDTRPEAAAVDRWLASHCRACAIDLDDTAKRDLCAPCRRKYRA